MQGLSSRWPATRADLASVPVPDETSSYTPIPYTRLLEEIELQLPRFGLTVTDERYGLAHEGNQLFGVFTVQNGSNASDWSLAIGLRSSYDRSLSVGLVAGYRVTVCDNLSFNGEVESKRKHTSNLFRDLPEMLYCMLLKTKNMTARTGEEIERMRQRELNVIDADHMLVESVRRNILPASNLPKVLDAWETPPHAEFEPRTAWSLFNAYTEVLKSASPQNQMRNTLKLSELFRSAV